MAPRLFLFTEYLIIKNSSRKVDSALFRADNHSMTNSQKFPLSADDARIAAREDDYAAFCASVDAELLRIKMLGIVATLNDDLSAS